MRTMTCCQWLAPESACLAEAIVMINALIESFFSHLKTEGLYPYDIRNIDEAKRIIEEYIRFYNQCRPQRKLNKLPPKEYRK
ncbi:IS3 family transposase [Paenibacillus terrae]|uniref:IS3 family transposase n=1 Tax=Paenibacillus terrae TaxID=159743 RepID=UPI00126A0986